MTLEKEFLFETAKQFGRQPEEEIVRVMISSMESKAFAELSETGQDIFLNDMLYLAAKCFGSSSSVVGEMKMLIPEKNYGALLVPI